MKNLLRIEEAALATLSIFMIYNLNFNIPWWVYVLVFLAPDIGMLGYVVNNKVGAITYNLCHLHAVATVLVISGSVLDNPILLFAGWMLFLHISVDRIFGFGLKYFAGFKFTHLGPLK